MHEHIKCTLYEVLISSNFFQENEFDLKTKQTSIWTGSLRYAPWGFFENIIIGSKLLD